MRRPHVYERSFESALANNHSLGVTTSPDGLTLTSLSAPFEID